MYSLLVLALVSFLLSSSLTPILCAICHRFGIVDRPDNSRKLHQGPIPRLGGIAVALSYGAAFSLLLFTRLRGGTIIFDALPFACKLFPAAALVFTTGLLDDLIGLKPVQKLFGQLSAALLAYFAGIRIDGMAGQTFAHWWSLPVTVLWLVACMNAMNLIDGVDGVAAGVGLFATATSLVAALMQHNVELAFATLPLAASLLGFLRYNFNPARIFLGDCGSLFIGFLLGCYGVLWSQKSATVLGMAAPLIALSIPLLDTFVSILRRFLRRQPIFGADRGHIHHRLLDRGLSPRRVALLLYATCALCAVISLSMLKGHFEVLLIAIFCAFTVLGIQRLGYVEFDTAGRMLLQGSFRRLLNSQISIQTFQAALARARTPDDCWSVIKAAYKDFGFHQIEMHFAGRQYSGDDPADDISRAWRLQIPLPGGDYVLLTRSFGRNVQNTVVALFAETLRSMLETKLGAVSVVASEPPSQQAHPGQWSSAVAASSWSDR